MESQTNEVRLQMKNHQLDLLDIEKFQEFVKSKYPSVTLKCKSFGISLNGKKQEVDNVYRKIEETIGGVKFSSMTVSKSVLKVLKAESVYMHLLTLFRAKLLNCAYDASGDCGTIVFVHGFVDQQIEQAKTLISIEIQECKIQMTKALKPLLISGTILILKLETEQTKGYLKYSIGENYLKLCGVLDSLGHIKSVIDKMTNDSATLSKKSRQSVTIFEKEGEQLTQGVHNSGNSEFTMDIKEYESILLSNCVIVSNISIAFPDLQIQITPSSITLKGQIQSIQTAEIQIREIQRAIVKSCSYSLVTYIPLLDTKTMFDHIASLLLKADINGTYSVMNGALVYLYAINEIEYDQLKSILKTALKEMRYYFRPHLTPCLLSTGCLRRAMQSHKESGLVDFIIFANSKYVKIFGVATVVNKLVLLLDTESKKNEPSTPTTCNHSTKYFSNVNFESEIPSSTNKQKEQSPKSRHDSETATGENAEVLRNDTRVTKTCVPETYEADQTIVHAVAKDISISLQHSRVLLQHQLSDQLKDIFEDIIVDILDNHIHLSGSEESVETASHFIEGTIDSIKYCKIDIQPGLGQAFENEQVFDSMHLAFRNLGAAATYEIRGTVIDVYAIGNIELTRVVQYINEILPSNKYDSSFELSSGSLEGIANSNENANTHESRSISGEKTLNYNEENKHRTEIVLQLDGSSQLSKKDSVTPDPKTSNMSRIVHTRSSAEHTIKLGKSEEPLQSCEIHQENILDTQISAASCSVCSLSLSTTTPTNTTTSHTLPFQTYAKDDVESLLTSKETHDSDIKDKNAESTTKPRFKFRNLASTSFKPTNPAPASSKHELVPSGSRHPVARTVSTPSTRQLTEDTLSTSSTSRFIMDTPLPSTSTQASTSIYSRSLSSNYEPMDIDMTSSYLYTPKRKQKLTIIDSFRVAKIKVSLVVGCITLCQVDVIINETNPDLNLCQGAVSSAILEKEEGMQTECNAKSPQGIDIGEVCITQANSMKCQFVYHVTCCEQKDAGRSSEKAIKDTVLCCLTAINDTNLSSVAISPLGTTRSRVPRGKSAVVMLEEIVNFLTNHKDTTISHIDIVLHEMDTRSHPVFEDEFANVALKFDPERRKTRSRYSWMRNYDWQL